MAAVSALPPQLKAGIHENPFPNQVPPRITELLDKLCTTNRFAEPNSVVYLRSQHCGDNSYIHFTCKSMRQVGADNNDQRISCVLRARKSLNSLDKQQYPIDRQVRMLAALYYQYKNMSSDFPIPELLGCDSGFDNTIGCPFLVYKEVEGTMFLAQYKMVKKSLKLERAQNLLDRRQLVCQMAEFIAKKEQLVLNGYGFIINESDIPTDNPRALTNSDNLGVISAKIAGSHISSSPSFGVFVGKLAYAWQRSARLTKDGRLMKHAKQLIFMTEKLWQKGLFEDQVPIVWNAKFYPENIKCYTNGGNLAAVVNWDHSVCFPRVMTREPPSFLWGGGFGHTKASEIQGIKKAFDNKIEQLLPGYLDDAYSKNSIIMRALGMYAFFGVDYSGYREISYKQLLQLFDAQFPGELKRNNLRLTNKPGSCYKAIKSGATLTVRSDTPICKYYQCDLDNTFRCTHFF